jgi:predicted phage-related endonuclease
VAIVERRLAELVGIGASEVPAIFGVSPYATASDVWLRKVGLGGGRAETAAMLAGRDLERPILRMAADVTGIRLTHNARTFAHPRWPEVPLFATPDGFGPGRRSVAEVKLVGFRFSDWSAGPPDYVRLQVQAQMACLPRVGRALVAALVGSELRTFTVDRDADVEDRLLADVVDWWYRYVTAELAPDPETPASAWRLARATTKLEDRQQRIATPDEQRAGSELLAITRQVDALEKRGDELRRELAEAANTSDIGGVGWSVTWHERADVSWKSVATEAGATPELVERYTKRSASFRFRSSASVEPDNEGLTR